MAVISKQLEDLLLLLRSRHGKEENLKIDSIPTSPQLPESRDVNRPEPKPSYGINATPDVTKASSPLSNRTIKRHQRISFEEIDKRRLNGLCLFCEESETPDHYLRHKNSSILMIDCDEDQTPNDEELVETEVGTESIETEQGKEELILQFQVLVSKLEHGLQIHNELPTVSVNSQDVVGCDELCEHQRALLQVSHVKAKDVLVTKATSVTINQVAHQLFDVIPLKTKVLPKEHKKRFHKSWRFKFKDKAQPRDLIQEKLGVHEANATRNQYLVSSVAVGDFQESQLLFNDELKDIQKFQIVIEEGSNSYVFQEFNGISLRSHILHQQKMPSKSPKSWKFKFRISSEDIDCAFKMDHWCRARYINLETKSFLEIEVMQEDVQHVLLAFLHLNAIETRYAIGERDEMLEVARDVSKRSMLCLTFGIRESNAGEEQQIVYEQIIMVNEWLHQISLVLQQIMRSKKIKFPKRWMFKYKYVEEDIKSLHNQLSYKSQLELVERFKSWSQRETIEAKQNLKNWYGDSLLEFLKRIEAGSSMIMVLYNNTELINYLQHLVKRCLVPYEDTLIEVRPPELFVSDRMVATKEEMEKDMKEDDQKQQGDWGHYFLLVAAANQSPIWSAGYHVWHCWKAR